MMVAFYSVALFIFCGLAIVSCASFSQSEEKAPTKSPSNGNASSSSSEIWSELLQKTPYPHTAPLPPSVPTVLDGTYTKIDPRKTPPVPCRRCPDYVPAGGIWKLNLDKGIYRIIHDFSGWRSIGSFAVDGNRVQLFNDPTCMEMLGVYTWELKEGRLALQVVEDKCAIGMRAKNLTQLPWRSCQAPSLEAGFSGHWKNPRAATDGKAVNLRQRGMEGINDARH